VASLLDCDEISRNDQVEVRFRLNLTAEQYLKYYEGNVDAVQVVSDDGRQIRFPAAVLRPYLTHAGISGYFVIHFDEQHRFRTIEKLDQ
jgi:hypothetical protein